MIVKIKEKLSGNIDLLHTVLTDIGCQGVKLNKDNFRFGKNEGGSSTGNVLNINTLHYTSFSSSSNNGDIISLVSEMLSISLGQAIKWLGTALKIDKNYKRVEVTPPFRGFYKNLSKVKETEDKPAEPYPMIELEKFGVAACKLFMEDGISPRTQEDFLIGYDFFTDRITIP